MNTAPTPELRLTTPTGPAVTQPGLLPGAVVQLFLFQGDRYLGWDCFAKDMVLVGGDPGDDLTLDGLRGSGARLVVYVDGTRVVVHDPSGSGVVRVNNEPTTTRVLGTLDVVTIGAYSLKARLETVGAGDPLPGVVETAPGHVPEPEPSAPAGVDLPAPVHARAEPDPSTQVEPCSEPMETVDRPGSDSARVALAPRPEGLDDPHALELFDALVEQATVPADEAPTVETVRVAFNIPAPVTELPENRVTAAPPVAETTDPEDAGTALILEEPVGETAAGPAAPDVAEPGAAWAMPVPVYVPDDEPDDEEDEDREAAFSLAELTLWNPAPDSREELEGALLQVARTRGGELLDLTLLDRDQRYRHPALGRRARPVARRDKGGRSVLTLGRAGSAGEFILADGRRVPLAEFLTPENRVSRRGDLYRVELPRGAQAHVTVSGEDLVIHEVPRRQSPEVQTAAPEKSRLLRNLASSSLAHVVLLMIGSLFLSLPSPEEPPPPETRFVQLDLEQLKPPAPKPPEAKPKPKPAAPVQVAKAVKAKPKPAAAPKPTTKKTKPGANPALASNKGEGPTSAAASPEAGGGHGGNARNRNIKKAGILGALGIPDGINLGASQAMAAVTNIDAVSSTRSSEAALKVGGIVGSLGSGRVEMPAVGLVNTKGSTQVVVSAGIGGSGTVAALERGKTGETQVRAMVTADIKVPASVSGGMSREEVKRVIDEHMDEVSYCYETALIEDAGLMGRMAFEWKILMSGRVGEVRIQSSSIQSDPLHGCIKRAIQTWQFPQPRGAEVLVSYPFVFDVVGF